MCIGKQHQVCLVPYFKLPKPSEKTDSFINLEKNLKKKYKA